MTLKLFFLGIWLAFLTGCGIHALHPGKSSFITSSGTAGTLRQSENPQQESHQVYKRTVEETPISPGGTLNPAPRVTSETIETTIGAAQKDTARELGAKLSSLKGIVWVGVLVFLFGAASFVYPPLKIVTGGSVTTSAVISASGLALIILPTLIVGNELLILSVSAGAAGLWFFAHRHGTLRGTIETLKSNILPKQ